MVLSSLVHRLFDQIRIFTSFDFPIEIKTFCRGKNYENFPEFRIVPKIYDHDYLRKQFCAILDIQGFTLKFYFRYFPHFLSYLQFGWQKLPFLLKFCEENLFSKFQKNDVCKSDNLGQGLK